MPCTRPKWAKRRSSSVRRLGLKVTVLDMPQLIEQGFGGILAVGKGSEHEPRFIVMEYGEAKKRHADDLPGG